MKKLLLATGIFLGFSMMASAQQKKSALPASTPTTQATAQKKRTIKDVKAEKNTAQMETADKVKAEKTDAKIKRAQAKKKLKVAPVAESPTGTNN